MTNLDQKLFWVAIGIGVGYLLFSNTIHMHHYGSSSIPAASTTSVSPSSPIADSGGLPPSCGCNR